MIARFLSFFSREAPATTASRYFEVKELWTEEESVKLQNFFRSRVGQKFWKVMNNEAVVRNAHAVNQRGDSDFECGKAAGFQSAITLISQYATPELYEHLDESEDNDGEDEDSPSNFSPSNKSTAPR